MKNTLIPSIILSVGIIVAAVLLSDAIKTHASAISEKTKMEVSLERGLESKVFGSQGVSVDLGGAVELRASQTRTNINLHHSIRSGTPPLPVEQK